jgi:hypothetical protein
MKDDCFAMKGDVLDPKGLIFEAFQIDGISDAECRSIFLDWALSLPLESDTSTTIKALLKEYEAQQPHPMIDVMSQGLIAMSAPRRRGGWRSRVRN